MLSGASQANRYKIMLVDIRIIVGKGRIKKIIKYVILKEAKWQRKE